jgi:pimeloyl-ACP methyl ester carboxylesterase
MSPNEPRLADVPLPSWEGVLPVWPGDEDGGQFVRRTPASSGETAVFVHGLGGSSTNWTDLMGLLAPTLTCLAPDLPGFGRSAPAPRYTVGTHVRAVIALLEQQDGPVHLFGNSLGGAVSTRVAAHRPDLVRSLTLVSPALPNLRPRSIPDPRLPLLLVPGLGQLLLRRAAGQSPARRAKATWELCYGDPTQLTEQRMAEAIAETERRDALPYAGEALAGSLRGLVGAYVDPGYRNLWRAAARVKAPTLLVWGTEDRLVDVAVAPKALARFRGSRLLVLPGVGHVAQMERPETVARAFLALREDCGAASVRA